MFIASTTRSKLHRYGGGRRYYNMRPRRIRRYPRVGASMAGRALESMTLVGRSDAAFGDQSAAGKCRLGSAIGLMPSALRGPRHIRHQTSKFTRKFAGSSVRGKIYAPRRKVGQMSPLHGFYSPFADLSPGVIGFEGFESPLIYLKRMKTIAEQYLVHNFEGIQQPLETAELDMADWLPALEKGSLPRLLQPGSFNPKILRPPRGIASNEGVG